MKFKEFHGLSNLALPLYSGLLASALGPVSGGPDASCSNGGSSTNTLSMLQLKGLVITTSSRDHAPTALALHTIHTRPVQALDFNDFPEHLISSPAINGDVWDLKILSEPYSPDARSSKFKSVAVVPSTSRVQHIITRNSASTTAWYLMRK
ncbi:hypothetical protein M407DRAFT_23610 [Tulasnella calospora MUT 4182]|uniref:Uncharacterized protein n=1 Tax=Tulasnella calospora MUT 4182 TaxID=1051891 RepID=A0A0C3QAD2_9AGAM|nr:hypothetical protein M407DRAFT_23610 [Tulasnella calospora MUT 4182]